MSYGFEMAADRWNLRARIPRALKILSDKYTVQQVIWDRLTQAPTDRLPPMERAEFPADILVDAVNAVAGTERSAIGQTVRDGCGDLLAEQVKQHDLKNLTALGELVYLSARIESVEAITPLMSLLRHPQANGSIRTGESLRARTMRALIGILVSNPQVVTEEHRKCFRDVLFDAPCTELAMIGLIGFFHESREKLLDEVTQKGLIVDVEQLDAHLRVAGFNTK